MGDKQHKILGVGSFTKTPRVPKVPRIRKVRQVCTAHQICTARQTRGVLVALAIYLVLGISIYWHVWSGHPAIDMQLGGDSYLIIWFLAWIPHALFSGHNPFYSNYANYPYGVNALVNTSEPLLAVLLYPVTALFGPIATFNLAMTLSFPASGISAYFLARRFTSWQPAAFACGLLYGFSPYMIATSSNDHLQLCFVPIPPLIAIVLHDLCVRRSSSPMNSGIKLGLLLVAQFFISTEVLASTVIFMSLVVVIAGFLHVLANPNRRRWRTVLWPEWWPKLRHILTGSLWATGLVVILLAYPTWFMLAGPAHISGAIQLVPQAYRSDLLSLVLPDSLMRFAPHSITKISDHFATTTAENDAYLGIALLLVLSWGVVALRRRRTAWLCAISAVVAFVISMGGALTVTGTPRFNTHNHALGLFPLPEALFAKVSILSNIIASRFSLYMFLASGILLALILEEIHQRRFWKLTERGRSLVALVVAVFCLVPLMPVAPYLGIGKPNLPSFFTTSAVKKIPESSVVLMIPYPSGPNPQVQLYQNVKPYPFRFKTPGSYLLVPQVGSHGHIAFSPTYGYTNDTLAAQVFLGLSTGTQPSATKSLRSTLLRELRTWHVRTVVFNAFDASFAPETMNYLTWLFGSPTLTAKPQLYIWLNVKLN